MHEDQLDVDVDLVARLVGEQFPQWRHLPVRRAESQGTDNAILRIGEDLAARLPLRRQSVSEATAWLRSEARAARALAAASPVPTPVPVALGGPGPGYPLPWAVQTWLPGRVATPDGDAGSIGLAHDLAALVAALRTADTGGRLFTGSGRGGHLPDHDAWMETCFRESEALLDVPRLRRLWADLRTLPPTGPDVLCHGDLIPGNLLVEAGRLTGVLDGGGFGPADPSLDLVCAWHLLDAAPREILRRDLGCGDVEWARGRAWALQQAMGLVWCYAESHPPVSRLGRSTLQRLLEDPAA